MTYIIARPVTDALDGVPPLQRYRGQYAAMPDQRFLLGIAADAVSPRFISEDELRHYAGLLMCSKYWPEVDGHLRQEIIPIWTHAFARVHEAIRAERAAREAEADELAEKAIWEARDRNSNKPHPGDLCQTWAVAAVHAGKARGEADGANFHAGQALQDTWRIIVNNLHCAPPEPFRSDLRLQPAYPFGRN